MNTKTIIVASVAAAGVAVSAQSCMAIATSSVGVAIIKQVLLGGVTKGLGIFKNKDSFLQNQLIEMALPSELKSINNILAKISPSLVEKEKQYIAQAAAYTVNIAEPILVEAINGLTSDDIARVGQGTTATQILKEKTATKLIAAISPKVDEKLNEYGIVKTLNTALSGNNFLGSLLGNSNNPATTGISKLASEQMVNGLFYIIKNYEEENAQKLNNIFNK